MNSITTKKSFALIVVCLSLLLILCSCGFDREYNEDIVIQSAEHDAEIVIKEWSFLLGSGAEIYYRVDTEETLLGKLQGGDNGFCPFKEGMYNVSFNGDEITVEWSKFANGDRASWETKTFRFSND